MLTLNRKQVLELAKELNAENATGLDFHCITEILNNNSVTTIAISTGIYGINSALFETKNNQTKEKGYIFVKSRTSALFQLL